jgi:activator of 2-hydroxyglutaryl-CoA dehydratase
VISNQFTVYRLLITGMEVTMTYTAGIDVGSTYTKVIILRDGEEIVGQAMRNTGFKLDEAARKAYTAAVAEAGWAKKRLHTR